MRQLSLFDFCYEQKKITKPIRLIELFAGIGSQAKALERLGMDFETYRVCEFDKFAVESYNAVHNTSFSTSDVTKIKGADLGIVDTDKYEYIMTYSFPCQDLSNAGKQQGMTKGSGTRSGLLWEVERLLNECTELPQILLMENVPQVHGTANIGDFEKWIEFLDKKGYKSYYQDLNAKDYGIPQNRNRCFMVSLLGDYTYAFPETRPLPILLKDVLEKEVPNEYYLSDEQVERISKWNSQQNPLEGIDKQKKICQTLLARGQGGEKWLDLHSGIVLINTGCQFEETSIKAIKYGSYYTWPDKKGNINTQCNRATPINSYSLTLSCASVGKVIVPKDNFEGEVNNHIRRLTPKEYWRLMGFEDTDFEKASKVVSNSQLYKQAGNSIVVDVLMAIFNQMR